MSVFAEMAGETPTGASKYFNEGGYIGLVKRCQLFNSQQGKGRGVAIEITILDVPLKYEYGRTCWIDQSTLPASNLVGEVVSTVLWLDRQKPAMGNLKGFLLAASGLTEAQIIRMHADQHSLDVGNPATAVAAWIAFAERATGGTGETLAGTIVAARAQRINIKATGGPFTRVVVDIPAPEVLAQFQQAPAEATPATPATT